MKRCTVLLALDMPLVVVDAIHDELTSDLSYPKDRAVKAFIGGNQRPGDRRVFTPSVAR